MRLTYRCEILEWNISKAFEISSLGKHPLQFDDGYEYAPGWRFFVNPGISVITCGNIDTNENRFFCDISCKNELGSLADFPRFVANTKRKGGLELWGFNNINFDDKLARANGLMVVSDGDLQPLIRLSAYGSEEWRDQPTGYNYSLWKIAEANGLKEKGALDYTAKYWQQGDYKRVINDSLHNITVTKQIFKLFEAGELIDPNTERKLQAIKVRF